MDGITRQATALNQDSRCNEPGAPQPSPAMNQDAFPVTNSMMNFWSSGAPSRLEAIIRNMDVLKGKMNPGDSDTSCAVTQFRHLQQSEVMGLDQRNDHAGSPISDDSQILLKVTIPSALRVFFARTKREPQPPRSFSEAHFGNS
jgi:hypothetical protein